MFRKIRLLVSSCDEKIFAWLEGRSPTDKLTQSGGEKSPLTGSIKSHTSIPNASNKMEIPDPWY